MFLSFCNSHAVLSQTRDTQVIVVLGVVEYCCCARPNGIVMLIPRVLTQKQIFLLGTNYLRAPSVIKSTMSVVVAIIAFAVAVKKHKQEHTHTHTPRTASSVWRWMRIWILAEEMKMFNANNSLQCERNQHECE